ncbi:hypothetical protein Syun_016119 [Stephania yunnanensis]|uniref:Reverse transcriptase Ty1/copia-type domain-containing protein n=1 Tax=Stephania yunnanensis TaxID=152371 RepID=A0AAP0J6U4_9MAGN
MVTISKNGIFRPKALVTQSPSAFSTALEPQFVKAALLDCNWYKAMIDEIQALDKNSTWTLVPPTSSMNYVGSKWVFKVKASPTSKIERYKAHLVAKCFHQTSGLD